MSAKLNDFTKLELLAIKESIFKRVQTVKLRKCQYCGEETKMRSNQIFCNKQCKTNWHNEVKRFIFDKLVNERAIWQKEREELINEISSLRKELDKRKAPLARR
jgi:hypothetical protein